MARDNSVMNPTKFESRRPSISLIRGMTSALMGSTLLAVLVAASPASGATLDDAPSVSEACQIQPDNCVLALVRPGEDPMVDAVRQLRIAGRDADAAKFVEAAKSQYDAAGEDVNAEMEAVLEAAPSDFGTTAADETEYPVIQSSRAYWDYYNVWPYTYCYPQGCDPEFLGEVTMWLSVNVWSNSELHMEAQLYRSGGPRIKATEFSCKTYEELWPFDQVVYDWASCENTSIDFFGSVFDNYGEDWDLTGDLGDQFHNEWIIQWKVEGDPTNSTLGVIENSNTFKIEQVDPILFAMQPPYSQ